MIKVAIGPGPGQWSQIHGLGANAVITRLEGIPRNNVDPYALT
jgi:hypothetical protein